MGGCLVELPAVLAVDKFFRIRRPGYLAHEVTHCLQLKTIGVRSTHRMISGAQWLADGSADWAAYEYFRTAYDGPDNWTAYITMPETSLFTRGYDGQGFFAHIARRANAWKIIPAMWGEWRRFFSQPKPFLVAQVSGGNSQAAQDSFLQSWAMSYARRRDLGRDWEMVGTGIPGPAVKATPTQVSIGKFGFFMQPLDEASVKLLQLNVSTGLVIRVSATGFGAIRWLKTRTEARFARGRGFDYCIISCVCPTGETLDPVVERVKASRALMALTGGAEKGFVAIRARSAADVCVPGTASATGPDPCIYSVDEATGLIASKVGGHHPVEDVEMQFFPKAPPIPKHVSPPKRAVSACLYLSSFGDAIWVDRLADKNKSLWISYLGYPRDEVLSGTGCC